jgi:hypothetical protein
VELERLNNLKIKYKENNAMAKSPKIELLPENILVKNVLLLKIAFTVFGIISYLFLPKSLLISVGIVSDDSIRFVRSLGFAYSGLLLVYCSGYFQIMKKNIYPINVVIFAIFTNSGAFILSLIYILTDVFNNVDFNKMIMLYSTGFLFFFIALMLIISLANNYKQYKDDIIWNRLR